MIGMREAADCTHNVAEASPAPRKPVMTETFTFLSAISNGARAEAD